MRFPAEAARLKSGVLLYFMDQVPLVETATVHVSVVTEDLFSQRHITQQTSGHYILLLASFNRHLTACGLQLCGLQFGMCSIYFLPALKSVWQHQSQP